MINLFRKDVTNTLDETINKALRKCMCLCAQLSPTRETELTANKRIKPVIATVGNVSAILMLNIKQIAYVYV